MVPTQGVVKKMERNPVPNPFICFSQEGDMLLMSDFLTFFFLVVNLHGILWKPYQFQIIVILTKDYCNVTWF